MKDSKYWACGWLRQLMDTTLKRVWSGWVGNLSEPKMEPQWQPLAPFLSSYKLAIQILSAVPEGRRNSPSWFLLSFLLVLAVLQCELFCFIAWSISYYYFCTFKAAQSLILIKYDFNITLLLDSCSTMTATFFFVKSAPNSSFNHNFVVHLQFYFFH